jgi:hypothetical protein
MNTKDEGVILKSTNAPVKRTGLRVLMQFEFNAESVR